MLKNNDFVQHTKVSRTYDIAGATKLASKPLAEVLVVKSTMNLLTEPNPPGDFSKTSVEENIFSSIQQIQPYL